VARIDAPQLYRLSIIFFDEAIPDTSQLIQFIYREAIVDVPDEARVQFYDHSIQFTFSSQTPIVEIACGGSAWKFSTMVQLCTSFSRPLSSVESLHIYKLRIYHQRVVENADQEWLDLLRPFTSVKNIYLCETSADHIAFVLLELVEGRLTEALPALQNILIPPSKPIHGGIVQFAAARELSGHPIAVSRWPTAWY
jgi:hypothetical protein